MDRPLATAAALALLAFGANMASPLYPGYQARLGFDDLMLTLIYATYAVASVPALLVLGPLADRLGRARLVRVGLLVAAVGSLCFAIGDHPAWLLAGRALQGVALGAATGAGMAILAETPSTARRRRYAAAGALAFLAGTGAGPGLTGLLAELVPAPHTTVHLLHLVLLVLVHHRLASAVVPGTPAGPGRWPSAAPQLPQQGRASYLAAMATGFVSWAVVGLFLGLVPSVLTRSLDAVSMAALGAVASVVVLAALPAQAVLPRLGAVRSQQVGLGLLAGALAVLAATGAAAPLPLTMAVAVLAGFGHGLAYGGAHGVVQGAATGDRAAGITATAYVVYYLGAGVPTIGVGLLSSTIALSSAISLLAGVLLVATLATVRMVRATSAGIDRVRAADGDAALSEILDLVRGALRGVHQANGVWHGVTASPATPVPPRAPTAGRRVAG